MRMRYTDMWTHMVMVILNLVVRVVGARVICMTISYMVIRRVVGNMGIQSCGILWGGNLLCALFSSFDFRIGRSRRNNARDRDFFAGTTRNGGHIMRRRIE